MLWRAVQGSAVELMTDIQAALDTSSSTTGGGIGGSTGQGSSSRTGKVSGSTSRLAPAFMRSLPPLGTVRSLYNFPAEYLPVIQQGRVVSAGYCIWMFLSVRIYLISLHVFALWCFGSL